MATVQKFLPYDNSSQANFDAWVEGIHDAIVNTMGWVQTSDTGQAGTNPSVPSSTYVYRIYKPADALQTGSTQYFLKVEFGFSSTILRFRVSVGTSTDGAGTLTGNVSAVFQLPVSDVANQGATTFECDFSGDTGRLGMMLWRNGTNGCQAFVGIERTLATDGTPSSDGVNIVTAQNSGPTFNRCKQQTVCFVAGTATLFNVVISSVIPTITTYTFNLKTGVFPIKPFYGVEGNPMTIVAAGGSADFGEGATLTGTLYGATRTYIVSGNGTFANFNNGGGGTTKLLMRYD